MIEIEVGKKKVVLPEKLNIRQYQKLRSNPTAEKDPIEFLVAITGLEKNEVKYSKKKDMDFVNSYLTEHYLTNQKNELKTIIELKGTKYGLMTDMSTLNFGGWVDLEFLTTEGVEKNVHKIMALMYRPIIGENKKGYEIGPYDHDEMEVRAELFLDLPIEYFWGVSNFFLNLAKAYTENIKASLEYQRTKEKALTRLRMMNPLKILYKLYHGFIGLALWSYLRKTLRRWTK